MKTHQEAEPIRHMARPACETAAGLSNITEFVWAFHGWIESENSKTRGTSKRLKHISCGCTLAAAQQLLHSIG